MLWSKNRYDAAIDLQDAFRNLRKDRGFTLTAILTLGLGIGAAITIFAAVYNILLRPLPYPDSERLVSLHSVHPDLGHFKVSYPDYRDWRNEATSFEALAGYRSKRFNFHAQNGLPERVFGARVDMSFFDVLGAEAVQGVLFNTDDDPSMTVRRAVISHHFWTTRLGARVDVVGQTFDLDGETFEIQGILAPQSRVLPGLTNYGHPIDVFVPLSIDLLIEDRAARNLRVIARLLQGVSLDEAQEEMTSMARRLREIHPESNKDWDTHVYLLSRSLTYNVQTALGALFVAVALLLLAACANVVHLRLTQHLGRGSEWALRSALGASPWRLARRQLIECTLLTLAGGLCALLGAAAALPILTALSPADMPRIDEVRLDATIVGATLLLSLLLGPMIGLFPALRLKSRSIHREALANAAGKSYRGRSQTRLRESLTVSQIALAVVLSVMAGLMARSLIERSLFDPGFSTKSLSTFRTALPKTLHPEDHHVVDFFQRLRTRLERVPGVLSVDATSSLPTQGFSINAYLIEGRPPPPPGELLIVRQCAIMPGYFETMGMRIVEGRDFRSGDVAGAPNVVVLSESLARRDWPDGDAIGRTISVGSWRRASRGEGEIPPTDLRVIGVVSDVALPDWGPSVKEIMYRPHAQDPYSTMSFVLRLEEGASLAATEQTDATSPIVQRLYEAIAEIDPALPIFWIQDLETTIAEESSRERFTLQLLAAFAFAALGLAALGVYGVMSHTVARRRHEIGVRMALGAREEDVTRMMLRRILRMTFLGLVLGILASLPAARLLGGLLFGVDAEDPSTLLTTVAVLTLVAVLAGWRPAYQASKVDPMETLRCD